LLIESAEMEPGTLIRGKYRIVRQLGRGGMGTVYLAEHLMLGRLRALKFISKDLSQDPAFLKRFRREALAASELQHPNVAQVVDLDQAEDGNPFIAMEYVEGPDLRHALEAGPFPVERALAIARGIALGLGAAHEKGVVHRDVKPENILLAGGNGQPETPKLLDFGIAAMKESATVVSRTHGLMLTPPYAAPEQWKGMSAEEIDGRTDLYALGGVLYLMLTGKTAFQASSSEGWMYQHLQEQPLTPSQLRPELSNWLGLDALVLRLLAKDRKDRPKEATELVGLIDAVQYLPTEVHREIVGEDAVPVSKRAEINRLRRLPIWVWLALVLVLLVTSVVAGRIFWPKPPTATRSGVSGVPPGLVEEPLPQNAGESVISDSNTPTTSIAQQSRKGGLAPWKEAAQESQLKLSSQTTGKAAKKPDIFDRVSPATQQVTNQPVQQQDIAAVERQAKALLSQKRFAEALPLFDHACTVGNRDACVALGRIYEQALGVARDYPRAAALFSKACDAGIAPACSNLSDIYAFGAGGVKQDIPRAQELARKACAIKKIPTSACPVPAEQQ
jgi:serine/threonine protein kinase